MAIVIKPAFQSTIADDPADLAAGYLTPSRWNAAMSITGLTANQVLLSDGTDLTQSANLTFVSNLLTATGGFATGATAATFKIVGRAAALQQPEFLKGDGSTRLDGLWAGNIIYINGTAGSYVATAYIADTGSSVGRFTLPGNTGSTFGWSGTSNDAGQAIDTAFTRISAGVVGLGTGGAGSSAGTLRSKYQSSDGTAGVSGTGSTITCKDGIITAIS